MTQHEELEAQIRHELATEPSGIRLSNKLFSPPNGLFCRLGGTQDERRVLMKSPLFLEALERLAILREQEHAAFTRAVEEFQALAPEGAYRLRLEEASVPRSL